MPQQNGSSYGFSPLPESELTELQDLFGTSLLEDIRMFIDLNEWSDEVTHAIAQNPDIAAELAFALHNDDIFADFFETRLKQLLLECAS